MNDWLTALLLHLLKAVLHALCDWVERIDPPQP